MNNMYTKDFKAFILKNMKLCDIKDQQAREILSLDEKGDQLFLLAMTHRSKSEVRNYNALEKCGDVAIGCAIANILHQNNVKGASDGVITMAEQKIRSETILSKWAKENGYEKFIIGSVDFMQDFEQWKNNKSPDFEPKFYLKENIYIKTLEDTAESMMGAMFRVVNQYSDTKAGVGMECVWNWVEKMMKTLTFDPYDITQTQYKTQALKELWVSFYSLPRKENNYGEMKKSMAMSISNKTMYRVKSNEPGSFVLEILDPYPYHYIPHTKRRVICLGRGYNEKDARLNGATIALPLVQKMYDNFNAKNKKQQQRKKYIHTYKQ